MKWIYTILLLVLVGSVDVLGQSLGEKVKGMYPAGKELNWLRFYRGRINDINEVVIALGNDGQVYKGLMQYMRSKETFHLEGNVGDGKLLYLTEKDSLGTISGSISGSIEEFDGIVGEWFNQSKSVGLDIELIPYAQEPRYPTYCGDNKWVRVYSGLIGKEMVELILNRGGNGKISGLAFFETERKSYGVEGSLDKYKNLELMVTDENWKNKGKIEAKINFQTDDLEGKFKLKEGEPLVVSAKILQTLSVGCMEYANYESVLEATFPKARNAAFNQAMKAKVEEWISATRTYTQQYGGRNKTHLPSNRATLRSYFWYDVDYLTEDIISGVTTNTNTWEETYDGFAFNYNIKTGEEITMENLFIENSGYNAFIYNYIKTELKKRPYYTDAVFQNWIQKTEFAHFTIRKEGLHFSTDFNGIFGAQHCTVPYSLLIPFFKPDNPIADLVYK